MTLGSPVTVNLRISQTGDFLAPGETGDKTFVMNVMNPGVFHDNYVLNVDNDAVDEPDGTITCTLLPGDGYAIDSTFAGDTQPIRDDDPTIVTLSRVGSGAASEGGRVEFTVTLGRELVAGEIIDVPLDVSGGRPTRGDWRLAKYNGPGFNTGVRLRPEGYQIVSFQGAGARVARLVLMPLHDAETEGTVTYTVALQSDAVFDRASYRTNVGGGADPHASRNSFSLPVNDVAVPTRCTHTTNHPLPGCVWITGSSPVREGGNVTFTVHADPPPPDDLDVTFIVHDAGDLSDYLKGSDDGFKKLTIPKGRTSATWTVATVDDSSNEEHGEVGAWMRYKALHPGGPNRKIPNEADFYYGTRNPRMAWVTVLDNDPPPLPFVPPKISIEALPVSGSVAKGAWASFCTTVDGFFEHTPRNNELGWFHVDVEVRTEAGVWVRGSAQQFRTGQTGRFCSRIDTAPWAGQTLIARVLPAPYQVVLNNHRVTPYVPGASPTATLTVGASPAGVSFANGKRLVAERFKGTVNLNVDIVPAASSPFTLNFALEGTATPGADYSIPGVTGSSGTVAVPAGAARVKIPVTMIDDTIEDDDETIIVRLRPSGAYQPAAPDSVTVTIRNEDPDPLVTVTAGSAVTEGGDAAFTVTATPPPAADLPVTVSVGTDGDWGVVAGRRTVTIPTAGSATLSLATTDDDADEPDGSVSVTVVDGDGYAAGDPASGTVAVRDDDDPAPVDAAVDPALIAEVRAMAEQTHHGTAHVNRWRRVLVAFGVEDYPGLTPMTAAEAEANAEKYSSPLWPRIAEALRTLEAAALPQQDQQQEPEIAVSAGDAVTEGGDAVFTLTATPAPSADLAVSVTVATDGDWGVTAGTRTVTIPTSGSATLTLATTGDDADEPDGSVSVTVMDGEGYTVGSAASGTVAIQDDDDPAPVDAAVDPALIAEVRAMAEQTHHGTAHVNRWRRVLVAFGVEDYPGLTPMTAAEAEANAEKYSSPLWPRIAEVLRTLEAAALPQQDQPQQQEPEIAVSAGSAVTEGGSASFTLTATPPPAADLAVSVTVAATGAYGIAAGTRTVTIPTSGSATLRLATTGDDADEPDGSVSVTVADGSGYTVGSSASATVAIRDDDGLLPEVTIAAKAASVTEGGNAVFTLTASPAPSADLPVSVTVGTDGDWGVAAGSRTVTILTSGSATLTLATTDDDADEADGSVTVTLTDGDGYEVGSPASATVAVRDDDAMPAVSVTAGDAVTEGGDAAFTLTASPAPAAVLEVSVTVTADGDFGVAAGRRTVTIPTAGSATLRLATADDSTDEADGSITVTVEDGADYTAGDPASGTVAVRDDDEPPPVVSVDDATVTESGDGDSVLMTFTARLSRPATRTVTVRADTRDSTPASATAREDYWPLDGEVVRFRPGEVERSINTLVYDDSHNEGEETFELVLSEADGATIGDGVAVGTIVNHDPIPAAWLGRFGRVVADQALDGIAARVESRGSRGEPRAPGFHGVFAGVSIGGAGFGADACPPDDGAQGPAGDGAGSAEGRGGAASDGPCAARRFGLPAAGAPFGARPAVPAHGGAGFAPQPGGFGGGAGVNGLKQLLMDSRFTYTGGGDASGGVLGFWGRRSQTRFDGTDGDLDLEGDVATAMLGADYARGNWLAGVALTQSSGDGGYRGPAPAGGGGSATDGAIRTSRTAAIPYAAWRPSERLGVWGAAGYGSGDLRLAPDGAGSVRTGIDWTMAAAGLKSELFSSAGGTTLALVSDALWTGTGSDRADGLAATESSVSRLRLGIEGGRRFDLPGGGSLTPKLEAGARHDGGDAETGFGVEVGGGIAWTDPRLGLRLDLEGRTLLIHEDGAMRDRGFSASLAWDPRPYSARGLSLALRQDVGGPSSGGLDALFANEAFAGRRAGHVDRGNREPARWTAEMGYGLPAFGGRFVGTPQLGYGVAYGAREIGLGWRLSPEAKAGARDLGVAVLAARRESLHNEPADRRIGIEVRARW